MDRRHADSIVMGERTYHETVPTHVGTLSAGPCGHVHWGFHRLTFSTMSKSCGGCKWHKDPLLGGSELSVSPCSEYGQAWISVSSWTLIEMRNLKAIPCDRDSVGPGNKRWFHELRSSSYSAFLSAWDNGRTQRMVYVEFCPLYHTELCASLSGPKGCSKDLSSCGVFFDII